MISSCKRIPAYYTHSHPVRVPTVTTANSDCSCSVSIYSVCEQWFDYVCVAFVLSFIDYCNNFWEYRHCRSARTFRHASTPTASSRPFSMSVPLADLVLTKASLKTKPSDNHPPLQRKRLRRTNLSPSIPLIAIAEPANITVSSPLSEASTLDQAPIQVP